MAVTAESTEGGLQPVETLAEIEAEVVGVGGGSLIHSLYDAGSTLIGVAVDLIVAGVVVTGIQTKEGGVQGTAIADAGAGADTVCLGKLFHIRPLERAVVAHYVAAVYAARVANVSEVRGSDVAAPVAPLVAGGESWRDKQVDVAVLIFAYAVIKGLRVEVQRTAEADAPTAALPFIMLTKGKLVCIVPKVVKAFTI